MHDVDETFCKWHPEANLLQLKCCFIYDAIGIMQKKLILMASILAVIPVIGAAFLADSSSSSSQSPYVNQLTSPVRGLSAQEVDDLLNGRGAGFARMAELNDYPGPLHLLELKTQLNLSVEQTEQIQAVFERMNAKAKQLGELIVEREQQLSRGFATGTITPAEMQTQTGELAKLYGELRAAHLAAHLEVTPLLSPEQISAYNALRGYADAPSPSASPSHDHEHHGH